MFRNNHLCHKFMVNLICISGVVASDGVIVARARDGICIECSQGHSWPVVPVKRKNLSSRTIY